jgi:hypothetical protein
MKKILILMFLVIVLANTLQAQPPEWENCPSKEISTNPDNPIDYLERGEPFLNDGDFDWRYHSANTRYDWYKTTDDFTKTPLLTPFSSSSAFNVGHLGFSPTDDKVEDGWELVTYRNGLDYVNPNYQDPIDGGPKKPIGTSYPMVVLYNKYTSLLRVFFFVPTSEFPDGYQYLELEISFENFGEDEDNFETAMFSHIESPTFALDKFEKRKIVSTVNQLDLTASGTNSGTWAYAEFPIAYDPCTCREPSNFEYNRLKVIGKLIDNATITLNGDISTENTITNKNVGSNTGIFNDLYNYSKGDNNTLTAKYAKVYDTQAKFLDKLTDGADKNKALVQSEMLSDIAKFSGAIATGIPYLGAAIGLVDMLVTGGKSANKSSVMPVSFSGDISLTGSITSELSTSQHLFYAPGDVTSQAPVEDYNFAMYNEVLGVFSLLETPKLKYVDYLTTLHDLHVKAHGYDFYGFDQNLMINTKVPIVRQYKLDKMPAFAVNPASNLELIDIKASILNSDYWEQGPSSGCGIPDNNISIRDYLNNQAFMPLIKKCDCGPNYSSTGQKGTKIYSEPYLVNGYNPNKSYVENLDASGFHFEYWPKDYPTSCEKTVIGTNYVPFSCLEDLTFATFYKVELDGPEVYDYDIPENFFFKVQAYFKRKDDPNAQPIAFVMVYHMDTFTDINYPAYSASTENPEILDINNYFSEEGGITILENNSQPAYPFKISLPSNLEFGFGDILGPGFVEAINKININDGAIISPGTDIFAGQEIIINPEVEINPEVTLTIGYTNYACDVNQDELKTSDFFDICNNVSKYDPKVPQGFVVREPEPEVNKPEPRILSLQLYPNPTSEIVYLNIELNEESLVDILVYDMQGRLVKQNYSQIIPPGVSSTQFSLQGFQPGVYNCIVRTPTDAKAEKIILHP